MTSVYLAAKYSEKENMAAIAMEILALDPSIEITSNWIWGAEETLSNTRDAAHMDYDDVKRADVLVTYTQPNGSYNRGGGRHTELGLALAWGKPILIIGPREQVFHHHDNISQLGNNSSIEDIVDWIRTSTKKAD